MNEYRITYNNGNPEVIFKSHEVTKENNGYIIWNGLNAGITFLNGKFIDKIEII